MTKREREHDIEGVRENKTRGDGAAGEEGNGVQMEKKPRTCLGERQ